MCGREVLASRDLPAKYVFGCKPSHGEVKLLLLLILLYSKNGGHAVAAIEEDPVFSTQCKKPAAAAAGPDTLPSLG